MKCNYCPATGTLKRIRGRTPTGLEVSVLICAACRDNKADVIAEAKATRRLRRQVIDLAQSKNTPPRRGKRGKIKSIPRAHRAHAQKVMDEAIQALGVE